MDRYSRVAPARPLFLPGAGQHQHHLHPAAPTTRRSAGAERELDIFSAERYFNAADAVKYSAAAVHADETPRQFAVVDVAQSQSGRTAASSEASWNSRSGLLLASNQSSAARQQHDKGYGVVVVPDTRDDRHHRGGKKSAVGGSGQRWGIFSRDCPCAGRKAVTVDVASEPTTPRVHARFDANAREESAIFKANGLPPPSPNDEPGVMKIMTTGSCGAFPLRASNNNNNILHASAPDHRTSDPFPVFLSDSGRRVVHSGGFTFPVISPAKALIGSTVDELPHESLEVFRPIDEDSVVLVDPPPPLAAAGFLRAPAVVDEDAMSDASSDLFDLESFAASSSYPNTYRGRSSRRNSGDDDLAYAAANEPALSECMYAPSEASVVWSVATAEGVAYDAGSVANFSSAASACGADEFRFVPQAGNDGFTAAMSRSAGRKKGGGFLNSCRCGKAVSVGLTPVRVARPPAVPAKTAMGLESGGVARYHNRRVHMPVRT